MSDITSSRLAGLIIPHPQISSAIITAQGTPGSNLDSLYTEASPEPSTPRATSSPTPALELRAHGVATASSSYDLQILRGGYPGRGEQDAGFLFKESAQTDYYGWNRPTLQGWQGIHVRVDGGSQADSHPTMVAMRYSATYRGRVVAATHRDAGAADRVDVHYLDAGDTTWTDATAAADGDGSNHPAIVELASGRLVIYYWLSSGQIRAVSSDDGGDTWATYAQTVLPAAIDTSTYVPGRLRVAYSAGEVLLLAELVEIATGHSTTIAQYASGDDGSSFQAITAYTTAGEYVSSACVGLVGGGFAVVYDPGVALVLRSQALGSAYQPLQGTGTQVAAGASYVDLALCADDDGTVYAIVGLYDVVTGIHDSHALRSVDGGVTYEVPWNGTRWWAYTENAGSALYPTDYGCCLSGGQCVVVTRWVGVDYDDDSIGALYLGGYSTITELAGPAVQTWAGMELPGDSDQWSVTSAGAPTQEVTDAGAHITLGAGDALEWASAPDTVPTSSNYLRVVRGLSVASGGSAAAKRLYFRGWLSDNSASEYMAEVWISTTQYAVRDVIAGTVLATVTHGGAAGSVVSVCLEISQGGEIAVSHRVQTSPGDRLHRWTSGYTGTLTQDATPAEATGGVKWGSVAGTATDVTWRWGSHTASDTLYDLPAAKADLLPRRLSVAPVEIDSGYAVSGADGPAVRGDTWSLGYRARYGISRLDLDTSPSPRTGWRSVDDATAATIVWNLGTDEDRPARPAIALALDAINWQTGRLQGSDDGATWTTILEIDTAADGGTNALEYQRRGATISPRSAAAVGPPAATGTSTRWLEWGDLVDGTAVLTEGPYAITRCSSGRWAPTDTAGVRPVVTLDGVDDTEDVYGTADLWSPRWVGVAVTGADYGAYRLVIDAQDTATGDLRIGALVLGSFVPLADVDWGSSLDLQPGVTLTTRSDGSRSSRRLAPPRRVARVAWAQGGMAERRVSGTITADPDYVAVTAGGSPHYLGAPDETALLLAGLLREVDGPSLPIVVLPRVSPSSPWHATHRAAALYGRITSSVERQVVTGDPDETEVSRVTEVVVEEEL